MVKICPKIDIIGVTPKSRTPFLRKIKKYSAVCFGIVFYFYLCQLKENTINTQSKDKDIMKVKKTLLALCALICAMAASAQIPSVQLKTLDGKPVDTATLSNDGKPFVISFFATWCKPCNRELKAISEVYADWQDETGMKLIAISTDQAQNINKVKPLVDGEGWEYEVLLDPNSDFLRAMGIQMIPHVLIFDGEGKLVDQRSGYTEGGEQHIIEKIREIVSK